MRTSTVGYEITFKVSVCYGSNDIFLSCKHEIQKNDEDALNIEHIPYVAFETMSIL